MIFFGTQPRLTQVPPQCRASTTATLAPWPAAMRAQRTPPEPPPITSRSKSYCITASPGAAPPAPQRATNAFSTT